MAQEDTGYRGLEHREIIDTVMDSLNDTNKFISGRFIEEKSQAEIAKSLGFRR